MKKNPFDTTKAVVQELTLHELSARGIRLFVKRDDLIHSTVSGNKWRKLKFNIELAQQQKKEGILTFGGAYSNHLLATASACHTWGLKSIGIVRGDELNSQSNDTLRSCAELGMELLFVSREEYALRNDKAYHETLGADHPSFQLVPEGGANYYGMIGCQEILKEIPMKADHIFVVQGTATTSCGILTSLTETQKLHVVPVLKGFDSKEEMNRLFRFSGFEQELVNEWMKQLVVHDQYHFGGYGKTSDELVQCIQQVYKDHGLKLDPIYTGKGFYAMTDLLRSSEFDHSSILFVHTGGLQGSSGIEKKKGIRLFQ